MHNARSGGAVHSPHPPVELFTRTSAPNQSPVALGVKPRDHKTKTTEARGSRKRKGEVVAVRRRKQRGERDWKGDPLPLCRNPKAWKRALLGS